MVLRLLLYCSILFGDARFYKLTHSLISLWRPGRGVILSANVSMMTRPRNQVDSGLCSLHLYRFEPEMAFETSTFNPVANNPIFFLFFKFTRIVVENRYVRRKSVVCRSDVMSAAVLLPTKKCRTTSRPFCRTTYVSSRRPPFRPPGPHLGPLLGPRSSPAFLALKLAFSSTS